MWITQKSLRATGTFYPQGEMKYSNIFPQAFVGEILQNFINSLLLHNSTKLCGKKSDKISYI